ncbi:MAG: hypothetical protein J5J00_07765 [Deltaproteobacteria bacterium]|nr:hypothetical protein [Deltaproteobacteria bacterium]
MDNGQSKERLATINTTIGELIEAVTEIALEAGKTEQEGYKLASLTLESILRRRRVQELPVLN